MEKNLDEVQDINDTSRNASYWHCLYSFLILAGCIINTFIFTSIPRHNSILYPEYWYESLFCIIFSHSLRDSCVHIVELYIFTKERCLLKKMHLTKVFTICSASFAVPYCISYISWTLYLGYNHPMPFAGFLVLIGDVSIYMVAFWFLFPAQLRTEYEIKRQSLAYLSWRLWFTAQIILKEILSTVAHLDSWSWILPILIPLVRISSCKVAEKIVGSFPETNKDDVKFLVSASITISYVSFVTANLYSLSDTLVYGILVVELFLHMKGCYEIFKVRRRVEEELESMENNTMASDRRKKIQSLAMGEFIDAILPLAFGIAFSMAYYGPNANLIKNVKNDYFGGQAIDDVPYFYFIMGLMFGLDLFAMFMSCAFLHHICKINLFQGFCNMMQKYWMIFLFNLPAITMDFGARDINFGLDYSGQFSWITDEGRLYLICNSSDISEDEKLLLLNNSTLCL